MYRNSNHIAANAIEYSNQAGWRRDNAVKNNPDFQSSDNSVSTNETERRAQLRHRTVLRAARISSSIHRVDALGLVRNISDNGMMIYAYREFEVGETISVSLLDGDFVKGRVVWKDGSTIGVQFLSDISIDHLLAKPNIFQDGTRVRPPRISFHRNAMIRIGGNLLDIELCDLSQRGAKISIGKCLEIESRVQILSDKLRPISANVKWQVEKLVGLEFHRILSVEEINTWISPLAP
mgnify:CR=1 FL=1